MHQSPRRALSVFAILSVFCVSSFAEDPKRDVRVLRDIFAERLARALAPEHLAAIVADPEQPSLFASWLDGGSTVLTRHTALSPHTTDTDAPASPPPLTPPFR